ncbi:ABC multidrug transporter-like protein [Dipodascopsis uninucleata]
MGVAANDRSNDVLGRVESQVDDEPTNVVEEGFPDSVKSAEQQSSFLTAESSSELSILFQKTSNVTHSNSHVNKVLENVSEQYLQTWPRPKRNIFQWLFYYINFFYPADPPPIPARSPPSSEAKANILSRLTFFWMNGLMRTGYARPIHENDIPELENWRSAKVMTDAFLENLDKRTKKGSKGPLLWALIDTFTFDAAWSMSCRVIVDVLQMTSPQLSRKIIYFVADSYEGIHRPIGHGVGMVIGLTVMILTAALLQQQYFYSSGRFGSHTRTVLINSLYRKSLMLSNRSRVDYTNGKITNLMSTDTYRIEFCTMFIEHLFDAPVPLGICLVLLIVNIGVSSLCGFALLVLATPILGMLARVITKRRTLSIIFTDSRIRLMQELLQSMRVIKFFSWEDAYIERISLVRFKEIKIVRLMLILRSGIFALAITVPVFASMISFIVLSVTGHNMDPAKVFASLSLFNLLRIPLMLLPIGLTTGIDAYVAARRIQNMLLAEEMQTSVNIDTSLPEAIRVENASFMWEVSKPEEDEKKPGSKALSKKEQKKANQLKNEKQKNGANDDTEKTTEEAVESLSLKNLNFTVKRGELIVITGFIGSGKTSLLASLVGEMRQTEGYVAMGGKIAYCPQPWIQNATLKENILFGQEFDQTRYEAVLSACALEQDLKVLPAGDDTEIGERGINISGGQKSRITLARAAYYKSDIILLDDVLSAVDSHVGRHIILKCICGFLSDRTRLLATHQLHVLPHADRIIFMDGLGGLKIGRYDELLESEPKFAELLTYASSNNEEEVSEDIDDATKVELSIKDEKTEELITEAVTAAPEAEADPEEDSVADETELKQSSGTLMKAEEKQTDNVSWKVYMAYFRAGGGKYLSWSVAPLVVMVAVLAAGAQIMTGLWLSYWTQDKFDRSRDFYIGLFVALGVICAMLFFLLGWTTTMVGCRASVTMNMAAVDRVMHAPMSFFDTNPLGRIINRFSNDVESMDNTLVDAYRQYLITATGIGGVLILIIAYLHWFALALGPLLVLYILATAYYRASAIEIKRLDSNFRSKVFSHFSESLTGLTSIRAYNEQSQFKARMDKALDSMNKFSFILIANQRWLSVRLEAVAVALIFVTGILAVVARFNISASSIGLVLSYCIALSMQMAMLIKQLADVENHMNATERVHYYMTELPSEAAFEIPDKKPPPEWPQRGTIEMEDVHLRYRPGLPLVLKGLNLRIEGGQKIGICGRTGAGKSSIMVALYRLAEISSGRLLIDGIDVSTIGLNDLRTKLAIIPQDPVLFRGTIRSNLDPFNAHSDIDLWDALRRSGLIEDAPATSSAEKADGDATGYGKFHLDQPVDDDGSNFSLGERQLLALARALVRKFQILVLDEATSSVDYQTDAKIQEIIGREFDHCTMLCIAHRLKTIIKYDKILVLDAGKVAEFDEPKKLFLDENSIFHGLCLKSDINIDDFE